MPIPNPEKSTIPGYPPARTTQQTGQASQQLRTTMRAVLHDEVPFGSQLDTNHRRRNVLPATLYGLHSLVWTV